MSYLIQKINKINQKSCIIAKCKHKKDALLIIKSLNNNVGNYIFKIFEKEKYKTFNTYDELISYTRWQPHDILNGRDNEIFKVTENGETLYQCDYTTSYWGKQLDPISNKLVESGWVFKKVK